MYHLTLQEHPKSIPLAFIKGGAHDNEVVFMSDKKDDPAGKKGPTDRVDFTPYLKGMKARERTLVSARLNKALLFDKEPEDDIADIFKQVKSSSDFDKKMELHDGGTMTPLPDPSTRSILYAFGASGSGKSTFVRNYVEQWRKLFPKGTIYIFSRLDSDSSLDALKPKRVMIDDTLADADISAKDFRDSFVIFDDVDSLKDGPRKAVLKIMEDILQTGRHFNVYTAITSHLGSNYRDTRQILNEAHGIVVFPHGSSAKAISYVLNTYAGLDKSDIKVLMKLPSRWCYVRKQYPTAVVYSSGCYLLGGSA